MIDTSGAYFTLRYEPVYAKKLTINKGVDNVILFEFINQDEKPVNITGSTMVFRAVSQNGGELLIQKPMVILNAPTGRAKVTLTTDELYDIQAQPASYSITRASGNLNEAVFVDAQAGARAPVDIVDSVFPEFIPSAPLIIPTTELSNEVSYGGTNIGDYPGASWYWNGNPTGGGYYNSWMNTEFYSSYIEPTGPVTTVQINLINYTGTIKAQAAENYQSVFFNVSESTTYLNETKTIHMNIIGFYPLLRLAFNNSLFSTPLASPGVPAVAYAVCENGEVADVIITNNGSGYLAPPRIDFIGAGAGATAVATINPADGSVASITITNPGSGYWPVPYLPNPGAQPSPVQPNQAGAIVTITTGFVADLYYR